MIESSKIFVLDIYFLFVINKTNKQYQENE